MIRGLYNVDTVINIKYITTVRNANKCGCFLQVMLKVYFLHIIGKEETKIHIRVIYYIASLTRNIYDQY